MGQTIADAVRRASEAGNFFCHLEAEKDKLVFGKKIKITTQGNEFARLFVDNSQADKIVLGFCSSRDGESNRQLITINKVTEAGPQGTVQNDGTGEWEGNSQSWKSSTTFDATVAGVLELSGKELHTQGEQSFRRQVNLTLADDGKISAVLSSKGSWGGNAFSERGLAKMDDSFGNAVFDSTGMHQEQAYSFLRRAYFKANGDALEAASSSDFAEGGALYLALADLPDYLPESFAPDALSGWVAEGCADTEETVELDPESAAHHACEQAPPEQLDCWNQDEYTSGTEVTD